jgi:hypothetical protein
VPNPPAIGVTIGGLLLDAVVPGTKPRTRLPRESSLLSAWPRTRTPQDDGVGREYDGSPFAGGRRS